MANTLRIKRRAAGGAAGAPASLANAELAFNEQDNTLYYGTGTGGAGGTATSVIAIGGPGAFVGLSGDQTVAGIKTFSSTIVGSISGNAGTATALATARSLGLSGDVTGTASFNGTANATITATLANSGVTAGSYGSATQVGQVTVDAKGRVTAASNVAITFPVTSVAGRTGAITLSTSDVSEGTNLYFTDARVRANRLDQLAAPTAAVDVNSQRISGLADPTGAQDAALGRILDLGVEGVVVPERQGINGLHVVMAIEQQMRPTGSAMGHHHRMARRRAGASLKAQGFQILDQPISGAGAIGLVGGVGRDRGDAQKLHQPNLHLNLHP